MKINSFQECYNCKKIPPECFYCLGCQKFLCEECIENIFIKAKKEKSFAKCPFCDLEPFITHPNIDLKKIISIKGFICQICNESIEKNKYDNHILNCKYYKCKLCNLKFGGKENFFEHFSKDNIHIDLLISKMNFLKSNE